MNRALAAAALVLTACGGGDALVDRSEGGGEVIGFIASVDTEQITIESASGEVSETFEFGDDESAIPHLREGHQEIRLPVLVRWTVRDGRLIATSVDDVPEDQSSPGG